MTDFKTLAAQAEALIKGVPHLTANLANVSALIYGALEDVNWAGFYTLEGRTLVLGPFQGKPACIELPLGKGVCAAAAELGQTVVVPNVHEFPGHIACDGASMSEIVVPIKKDGRIFGVLDIDSPTEARFGQAEAEGLELLVRTLERELFA